MFRNWLPFVSRRVQPLPDLKKCDDSKIELDFKKKYLISIFFSLDCFMSDTNLPTESLSAGMLKLTLPFFRFGAMCNLLTLFIVWLFLSPFAVHKQDDNADISHHKIFYVEFIIWSLFQSK